MEVTIIGRVLSSTGKIHQNQEVMSGGGQTVTLKATHYKDAPKVLVRNESKNINDNAKYV